MLLLTGSIGIVTLEIKLQNGLYNVLYNVLHKRLRNDSDSFFMIICNKLRNTDIKILSSLHLQTFFDHFYSECDVTSRDWLDLLSILEQVRSLLFDNFICESQIVTL